MPETAHLIIDQTHSFRCVVKPSSLDHWPSQLSSWITKSQWLSLLTTDWERRAKGPYSLPLLAGSRAGVSTREATWGATPGIRAVVIFHQWWFSKWGLLNQSSSTWQLAICGNSQAPPWVLIEKFWRRDVAILLNQPSRCLWSMVSLRTTAAGPGAASDMGSKLRGLYRTSVFLSRPEWDLKELPLKQWVSLSQIILQGSLLFKNISLQVIWTGRTLTSTK